MTRRLRILSGILATVAAAPLPAQTDTAVKPFRMIGNIYYVGGSDVAIYLIATPDGLILLDGGYRDKVPRLLISIGRAGFDPTKIKILLNSHGHYDHAGGLAELKRVTGARLYAGRGDSTILANGGQHDFGFGNRFLFPSVTVTHPVSDGDSITLGGTTIRAVATPGHTKGCTTWSVTVREGGKDYDAEQDLRNHLKS
ncbi:MAG TPA: metallo-beta-lactamase [Gemmatimonadales bacterium]|nr:metallo-beta-lactamase [Gemmatimonadales bacterium]